MAVAGGIVRSSRTQNPAYGPARLPPRTSDQGKYWSGALFRRSRGLVGPRSVPVQTGPHGYVGSHVGSHENWGQSRAAARPDLAQTASALGRPSGSATMPEDVAQPLLARASTGWHSPSAVRLCRLRTSTRRSWRRNAPCQPVGRRASHLPTRRWLCHPVVVTSSSSICSDRLLSPRKLFTEASSLR